MTKRKLIYIFFTCILLGFIVLNSKIMPVKKELTDVELVKVIGMDLGTDEKYRVEETILRVSYQNQSTGSSPSTSGSPGSSGSTKYFIVKGQTFDDTIRTFQTYVNKSMSGSHIKYFLLGEEYCKKDMTINIDFNARDYEVRLNLGIYLTKGMAAKDFIAKVVNTDYDLDEKINSMEKNNEGKNVSYKLTVIDLIGYLSKKNSSFLMPTLRIISPKGDTSDSKDSNSENKKSNSEKENNIIQSTVVEKSENSETFFDFDGYAVIKDKVLTGYLNRQESITSNILKNRKGSTNIDIYEGEDNVLSFGMIGFNTKYKFKFDGDNLNEVIINTSFESNVDEAATKENIFKIDKLKYYEDKQAEKVKLQIEDVIEKMVEYKADFLDIEEKVMMSHPYKYKKIKDKWVESLVNAKFIVNVKCNIRRTFDIITLQDK
ncbi:MAG: Ger(x)C family spore germination protein [Clostridia bacterium]|nr:Ger(x)C family spore germination protein [Clostridia bacterium]